MGIKIQQNFYCCILKMHKKVRFNISFKNTENKENIYRKTPHNGSSENKTNKQTGFRQLKKTRKRRR